MARRSASSNSVQDSAAVDVIGIINKRAKQRSQMQTRSNIVNYTLLILILLITLLCYPQTWDVVTARHVFYYGWLTAVSTGLGVLPFFFISEPDKYYMGVSNGIQQTII